MKHLEKFGREDYLKTMRHNLHFDPKPLSLEILGKYLPEINTKKLRLILINTPAKNYSNDPHRGNNPIELRPPMGEYYLAANINKQLGEGSAIVVDMDKYRMAPVDGAEIIKKLNRQTGYNLTIGLNMFSPNRFMTWTTAKTFRNAAPGGLIILGGLGTTLEKGRMLEEFDKDEEPVIAFLGEAENELPKILINGWEGSDGVLTKNNLRTPLPVVWFPAKDLEQFPFPEIPPYKATYGKGHLFYNILSSRSCPHDCNFCAVSKDFPYRQYSAEYLEKLLRTIPESADGKTYVEWTDDNAWGTLRRAEETLDIITKLNAETKTFIWWLLARADIIVKAAEKGLLKKAKSLGLEGMVMGVESRSPEILRAMNKKTTVEIIDRAVEEVLTQIERIRTFTMIGYEGEKLDQVKKTIKWLYAKKKKWKNNFRYCLFIVAPYFGTRLYKSLLKRYPPWALQLYTEAVSMGNQGLIDEVDKLGIKISDLSLGELTKIASETDEELHKIN